MGERCQNVQKTNDYKDLLGTNFVQIFRQISIYNGMYPFVSDFLLIYKELFQEWKIWTNKRSLKVNQLKINMSHNSFDSCS